MAQRLHVAKEFTVRYSSVTGFDGFDGLMALDKLLRCFGIFIYDPSSCVQCDFDVLKTDWLNVINALKENKDLPEDVNEVMHTLGCDLTDITCLMQAMYDEAEPDDYWLHFSFF